MELRPAAVEPFLPPLVLREGDLPGRLLDRFVVAQLRAELGVSAARQRLYHVRQRQGRLEVGLLAELAGGRLVAIEVKAGAAPGPDSGGHLVGLRDRYDESFVAGIVLHTGHALPARSPGSSAAT